MNIYDVKSFHDTAFGNPYVGRGIVIGMSKDGKNAVSAYFIMGRSENSRNRVFVKDGDDLMIKPFDESKVEDPSLIIYYPVRTLNGITIVTNGDQTDTIKDHILGGGDFRSALKTRCFEPDMPNFTPRISAEIDFDEGVKDGFTYQMSILKSEDAEGSACARYFFEYEPLKGLGHFIHTYVTDGNPIPSFQGEPERINIPDGIEDFADEIWSSLDENNKISLYVRYTDIETGNYVEKLINKN